MIALLFTLLLLAVTPLFSGWFQVGRRKLVMEIMVSIIVLGLIVFSLMPHALEILGLIALPIAGLALFLPWAAERTLHHVDHQLHTILLYVAAGALLLHGAVDGAVLSEAEDESVLLIVGFLAHRFAGGLAIWWMMRPLMGPVFSWVFLMSFGASTLGGFLFADAAFHAGHEYWAGIWQALAAGSLAHILLHPLGQRVRARRAAKAGASVSTHTH